MKKSLNVRINLLMIIVVTVFFSIFGIIDYIHKSSTRTRDLHTTLDVTTDRLAQTLQSPVWDLDYQRMAEPVFAEMQNRNIALIKIYDSITGKLLVGKSRGADWRVIDFKLPVKDSPIQKSAAILFNNKKIAEVTVQLTDTFVKEEIFSAAVTQIQRMILLILTFSSILAVSINIAVLKPIRTLSKSVRAIAGGNIDEPIEIPRDDELGELSTDFSIMRDTIKQKIDGQNRDISERKKAEQELRHLRNYLTNIIDSMPSVLVGVDAAGRVTQWNKTAEKVTGVKAVVAQGKRLVDVFPQMQVDMGTVAESIRSRETRYEKKQKQTPEKEIYYEDVTIYPLIANGVEGAVIRIDDVSDKVRMEEMVVQSEKMLSVGGLAAGMAHEINNPLAGMVQTANVMAARLGGDTDIAANIRAAESAGVSLAGVRAFMAERGIPRMLDTINESGLRIAEIVNNMLSFARKSDSGISLQDMSVIMDKTLELASTDYDLKKDHDFKQIKIKRDYEPNLPVVPCEVAKIQQVLLNIFRNGAQAMQDSETTTPAFIVRTFFDKERNMVCAEVENNGPGMPEAIQKRIFEPFFTTKPVGIGTGLGLSVAYFIITENHGGELSVKSTPGSGTVFIIRLPLQKGQKEIYSTAESASYDSGQ